ncbi:MAG: hypothetical protein ABIS06_21680 [Vicinamibacterales bacterium]
MTACISRIALVSALVVPGVAWGQTVATPSASAPTREVRGQLGASINNLGLQNTIDVGWTWPLSQSTNPLLSGAHVRVGITNVLTPAQARLGGWLELAPLSILEVRLGVDPSAYFGTFNSLQGFPSYAEPFDTDARKARGGGKAGTAARLHLSPTLKMKKGPIVAAASADLEWWRSNADGEFFYEPTRDTLLNSGGDRLVATTAVVMYQRPMRSGTLSMGAIHNMTRVADAPENRIQKLGGILVREFDAAHFHLPRPRLTAVVSRYLDDPSKSGQWSGALAIGFSTR